MARGKTYPRDIRTELEKMIYDDLSLLGRGSGLKVGNDGMAKVSLIHTDWLPNRLPQERAAIYRALILQQVQQILHEDQRAAVVVGLGIHDDYNDPSSGARFVQLASERGLQLFYDKDNREDSRTVRDWWKAGRIKMAKLISSELERRAVSNDWDDLLPLEANLDARPASASASNPYDLMLNHAQPGSFTNHLIHLSIGLEELLVAARDLLYAGSRRPFCTFDILRVLLDMPNQAVARCFEEVDPGLAVHLRDEWIPATFAQQIANQMNRHWRRHWFEYPDINRAFELALEDRLFAINEIHLLQSILEGDSNTNKELKIYLGARHEQVRVGAQRMRGGGFGQMKT